MSTCTAALCKVSPQNFLKAADNVSCWPLGFIIFLDSHLVNLAFVLLTDPSFIPQLQFICCSSTSFNSLSSLCLTLFLCSFFPILPLQREHKHNVLGACKASGFQAHTSRRPICLFRQSLYTLYTCDCLLELLYKLLASGCLSFAAVLKTSFLQLYFVYKTEEEERGILGVGVGADNTLKIFRGNEG